MGDKGRKCDLYLEWNSPLQLDVSFEDQRPMQNSCATPHPHRSIPNLTSRRRQDKNARRFQPVDVNDHCMTLICKPSSNATNERGPRRQTSKNVPQLAVYSLRCD